MNLITKFLDWLNATVVKAERKRREAYLASSANTYELEHRMRMLDRLDTVMYLQLGIDVLDVCTRGVYRNDQDCGNLLD